MAAKQQSWHQYKSLYSFNYPIDIHPSAEEGQKSDLSVVVTVHDSKNYGISIDLGHFAHIILTFSHPQPRFESTELGVNRYREYHRSSQRPGKWWTGICTLYFSLIISAPFHADRVWTSLNRHSASHYASQRIHWHQSWLFWILCPSHKFPCR